MELTKAIETLVRIKKGTFTKFVYKSDVKVKAACKDTVKISKYTVATARFGINYGHLKTTISKGIEKSSNNIKKTNYVSVLKHMIEYNTNTDKYYVTAYTSPNKPKVTYLIYKDGKLDKITNTKSDIREYVTDSVYSTSRINENGIYKVNLDNVIRIGKVG